MFIFEDYKNSLIARLFRYSYDNTDDFVYSQGNGGIKGILDNTPINTDVYIFLDVVPGNSSIYNVYNSLLKKSYKWEGIFIVIPIVCAEYNLLTSLQQDLYKDVSLMESLRDKEPYFSGEYSNEHSYENYCKVLLKDKVSGCVSTNSEENVDYTKYYLEDCSCGVCKTSLLERSIKLLQQYRFIPTFGSPENRVPIDDLFLMVNDWIDDFNKWSFKFKSADNRGLGLRYRPLRKQVNKYANSV